MEEVNKDLEIIKQMHDVAVLFGYIEDFEVVKQAYLKYADVQIKYRGKPDNYKLCLDDTVEACISILSNGVHFKDSQSYSELRAGIKKIHTHIFGKYTINKAFLHSSKVLYIATMIKYDLKLNHVETAGTDELISKNSIFANLNKIKKIDIQAFKYVRAAIQVIDKSKVD